MKIFTLAAAVALLPLSTAAQDRMTEADCQQGFKRLALMTSAETPDLMEVIRSVGLTADDWCMIRGADLDVDDVTFAQLQWRTEDGARWTHDGIPPLALEIRALGMDPDKMQGSDVETARPPVDAEFTFRQEPDAGLVILERMELHNGVGDRLTVSGVFERVFLSSPSMMQISMGSAAFKAGLLSVTLEGTHENPFGIDGDLRIRGDDAARSAGTFDFVSSLPGGVIDDASRAELMAYVSDLPNPVGTLDVTVNSARGLGMMQVGMSLYSLFSGIMDEDVAAADQRLMELLFDGITITADWTPAEQETD